MLDHILATITGVAIGYVAYKTLFEALRQAIQERIENWLQIKKRQRQVRRETRYRLLME